jgi:MFS family permease
MNDARENNASTFGIYLACILLCYTQAAGITTIYSMASTLYRIFDDPLKIGWVITSYYLVAASSSAICGRFGDLLGRRHVAMLMLLVGGIGAFISATASGLNGVIAGCTLQGAAGGVMSLAFGILRENLPPRRLPFAIGVMSSAATAGAGVSFLIAGIVIDNYSWNGGFYMKVILAIITVIALLVFVPAPTRERASLKGISILPGLLFAPAIAGVFVAIQLAHGWGWSAPGIWVIIAASLTTLMFWAYHQSRQATPLIYVRSLAIRNVLFGNLILAVLAAGWCQNGQMLSLILQQPAWTGTSFAVSATFSGLVLLGLNAVSLFASPWGGVMAVRKGARHAALIGGVVGVIAWTVVVFDHSSLWVFIAADFVLMVGLCIVQVTGFNLVVQATAPERTSEASGMTFVIFYTFSAIGGQIIFLLLASSTVTQAGTGSYPSGSAYDLALAFIEIMGLIGLVIAYCLPRQGEKQALTQGAASAS